MGITSIASWIRVMGCLFEKIKNTVRHVIFFGTISLKKNYLARLCVLKWQWGTNIFITFWTCSYVLIQQTLPPWKDHRRNEQRLRFVRGELYVIIETLKRTLLLLTLYTPSEERGSFYIQICFKKRLWSLKNHILRHCAFTAALSSKST